jgi:lipopolysaccharide transport system permease protein
MPEVIAVPTAAPAPAARVRSAAAGRWEHDRLRDRIRLAMPLLLAWSRKEYSVRYRQSLLGLAWSVVQPLAILAIFGGIMARVLHVSHDGLPYISFAYAGLVAWTFVSSVLLITAQSLIAASPVLGKVYFPREVVPLAQVFAFAIDLVIGTAILLVILRVQGISWSIHLIALLPIYLVLITWVATVSVLSATLTVFIRDLRYVMPLVVQLLFISSPIMYSPSQFPHSVAWINSVNPVAVLIGAIRDAALLHNWPDWSLVGPQAGVAVVGFVLVIAYVRSVEPRIVDVM